MRWQTMICEFLTAEKKLSCSIRKHDSWNPHFLSENTEQTRAESMGTA